MRQTIQKAKSFLSCRATEVLLSALLTVAIGVFAYGIKAQVIIQERVKENEISIVKNKAKIQATREASDLRDDWIMDQIKKMKAASDVKDEAIGKNLQDLKERLDQRCDTLENLLNLIYEAR